MHLPVPQSFLPLHGAGVFQEYMIGKNVLDYIHPCDHKELLKQFDLDNQATNPPGEDTILSSSEKCVICYEY